MADISQVTFSNAFSWMKMFEFRFKFYWIVFLGVELTINYWFRYWLGAEQATGHYLNQWLHSLLMHLCVTRPQWVKELTHHHIGLLWYIAKLARHWCYAMNNCWCRSQYSFFIHCFFSLSTFTAVNSCCSCCWSFLSVFFCSVFQRLVEVDNIDHMTTF